ncbi:MAG: hypothetical protein JJ863_24255 [Deltaproteobacteria bacterium]|nr:hypothetical protein [Deltaproteobacteria bacterium]
MPRTALILALLVACSHPADPEGEPTSGETDVAEPEVADAEPLSLPSLSEEGLAVLDRMSEWCTNQGDDCDVAERPDAYPDRISSGETNGWIHSHREQAAEHGIAAVWSVSLRRFVSQVEDDLRLIVGGHFSPDHLGPDVYDAILARAKARPSLYLGVLMNRVLIDDASWLSSAHVPNVPRLLKDEAPDDARAVARALLAVHRDAAAASDPPPVDDEYRLARLQERVRLLESLAD